MESSTAIDRLAKMLEEAQTAHHASIAQNEILLQGNSNLLKTLSAVESENANLEKNSSKKDSEICRLQNWKKSNQQLLDSAHKELAESEREVAALTVLIRHLLKQLQSHRCFDGHTEHKAIEAENSKVIKEILINEKPRYQLSADRINFCTFVPKEA